MYKDGGFHLSLPATEEEGQFRLTGDTIELHYATSAPQLPAAYLINRCQKRLDELHRIAGHWVVTDNTNWMQLQQESVRQYRRE
ncbi:hypothetical protein Hsw_0546 [Hymenobacter swuensis DY53]|uniref:Uncharacterized protein n=1 Tax=Hymenobacter swuensis DY53 TaxID=1227739 RepID=W8F0M1_9BACT|nr:hypothetical protein Hsw_0546 [Hymenobacter swuensis DY53]